MLFKAALCTQFLLLLVLPELKCSLAAGANLSQQKGVASAQQQQQQQLHQSVHQAPAQQPHSHPHAHSHQHQHPPQPQQSSHLPPSAVQGAQYVHEKESSMPDIVKSDHSEEELSDPYQFLNDFKHEQRLSPSSLPWNPFMGAQSLPAQLPTAVPSLLSAFPYEASLSAALHTPKYMPLISYPQPVFVPYPFYVAPEMFYAATAFGGTSNDIDESMSRAATGRRPASAAASGAYARNSPIYYVRLPPMPYMFLPSLSYGAAPPTPAYTPSLASIPPMPTIPLPAFSAFSSVFNLPMSFVANGKPSAIYQMGSAPPDIHGSLHFGEANGFGARPAPPTNPYRPAGSYLPQATYGISAPAPPPPHQDSKMTLLKRPFVFNGHPEDIYILPNNFNPLYTNSGYY